MRIKGWFTWKSAFYLVRFLFDFFVDYYIVKYIKEIRFYSL